MLLTICWYPFNMHDVDITMVVHTHMWWRPRCVTAARVTAPPPRPPPAVTGERRARCPRLRRVARPRGETPPINPS